MAALVSTSECIEVVRNALNLSASDAVFIQNFVVNPASSDAVGSDGEYFKLTITAVCNEKEHNLSLFLKSIPISNPAHRKEVAEKGLMEKEAFLYTNLLNELQKFGLPKWHADCYFTRRNDIIVLEDLVEKGFKHIEKGSKLSQQHFQSILKNFAILHATSIAYEVKTGINLGEKYGKMLTEEQLIPNRVAVGIPAIKTIALEHPKLQTEEFLNFITSEFMDAATALFELVEISKEFRNVLCHRDSWEKNFLFKYDDDGNLVESAFVDFQFVRYHPPALDIMFFIQFNYDQNWDDNVLEQLLHFYYDNLERNFEILRIPNNERVSWEEFRRSYDVVKPVILLISALAFPDELMNELGQRNSEERSELLWEFLSENECHKKKAFNRTKELVKCLFANYKKKKVNIF